MNVSKVEKVGSIFSRMTGLLRSGLIKWEDRPLWYDIYVAFPPIQEPRWDRPPPEDRHIRQIIYPEDKIRAHFYRQFGSMGTISMTNAKSKAPADKFVQKFYELYAQNRDVSEDDLLHMATAEFRAQAQTFKLVASEDKEQDYQGSTFKPIASLDLDQAATPTESSAKDT